MILALGSVVFADELHLTGGKIITGQIVSDTGDIVKIKTEQYGEVSFPRNIVEKIIYAKKDAVITPTSTKPSPSPSPSETRAIDTTRPSAKTVEILPGYDAIIYGAVKEVYVHPAGGGWIAASPNMQLKVKDEIRTSLGKVKMKIRGRGEVRLPPNSHIILQSIDPKGDKVTIELKGGASGIISPLPEAW